MSETEPAMYIHRILPVCQRRTLGSTRGLCESRTAHWVNEPMLLFLILTLFHTHTHIRTRHLYHKHTGHNERSIMHTTLCGITLTHKVRYQYVHINLMYIHTYSLRALYSTFSFSSYSLLPYRRKCTI